MAGDAEQPAEPSIPWNTKLMSNAENNELGIKLIKGCGGVKGASGLVDGSVVLFKG